MDEGSKTLLFLFSIKTVKRIIFWLNTVSQVLYKYRALWKARCYCKNTSLYMTNCVYFGIFIDQTIKNGNKLCLCDNMVTKLQKIPFKIVSFLSRLSNIDSF